jgi:hypothetical protein
MTGIELIFILVALPLCVVLFYTPEPPRPYDWEVDGL